MQRPAGRRFFARRQASGSGGRSGALRIWSLTDGQTSLEIAASRQRIRTLAYTPDSETIAAAGDGRSIGLWNAASGAALGSLPCPSGKVLAVQFCSPGMLASAGTDNIVRLWDLPQQLEQRQLQGHTGTVTSLAYDANASVLVSASFDTTIRMWPIEAAGGAQARSRQTGIEVH